MVVNSGGRAKHGDEETEPGCSAELLGGWRKPSTKGAFERRCTWTGMTPCCNLGWSTLGTSKATKKKNCLGHPCSSTRASVDGVEQAWESQDEARAGSGSSSRGRLVGLLEGLCLLFSHMVGSPWKVLNRGVGNCVICVWIPGFWADRLRKDERKQGCEEALAEFKVETAVARWVVVGEAWESHWWMQLPFSLPDSGLLCSPAVYLFCWWCTVISILASYERCCFKKFLEHRWVVTQGVWIARLNMNILCTFSLSVWTPRSFLQWFCKDHDVYVWEHLKLLLLKRTKVLNPHVYSYIITRANPRNHQARKNTTGIPDIPSRLVHTTNPPLLPTGNQYPD